MLAAAQRESGFDAVNRAPTSEDARFQEELGHPGRPERRFREAGPQIMGQRGVLR